MEGRAIHAYIESALVSNKSAFQRFVKTLAGPPAMRYVCANSPPGAYLITGINKPPPLDTPIKMHPKGAMHLPARLMARRRK